MAHNRENTNWTIPDGTMSFSGAQLAALMDIRAELRVLNQTLSGAVGKLAKLAKHLEAKP